MWKIGFGDHFGPYQFNTADELKKYRFYLIFLKKERYMKISFLGRFISEHYAKRIREVKLKPKN